MFTEAQLERIREIRWALQDMPGRQTKIAKEDVALLLARVDDLDCEECSCAGEIINWTRDRLAEDLISKRTWLEDALENVRIAELMVRSLALAAHREAWLSSHRSPAKEVVHARVPRDHRGRGDCALPGSPLGRPSAQDQQHVRTL